MRPCFPTGARAPRRQDRTRRRLDARQTQRTVIVHTRAEMNLRRRLPRRMTSLVVVVSLLFAQFAMARYVCPGAADVHRMIARKASGTPCDELDAKAPLMCRQHAIDASQSFE